MFQVQGFRPGRLGFKGVQGVVCYFERSHKAAYTAKDERSTWFLQEHEVWLCNLGI